MNVNAKINKVLLALNMKGEGIRLQRNIRYSKQEKRNLTSYVVYRNHPQQDGEFFGSSLELLEYLVSLYMKIREDELEPDDR